MNHYFTELYFSALTTELIKTVEPQRVLSFVMVMEFWIKICSAREIVPRDSNTRHNIRDTKLTQHKVKGVRDFKWPSLVLVICICRCAAVHLLQIHASSFLKTPDDSNQENVIRVFKKSYMNHALLPLRCSRVYFYHMNHTIITFCNNPMNLVAVISCQLCFCMLFITKKRDKTKYKGLTYYLAL